MAEVADTLDDIRAYNRQRGPVCTAGVAISAMPAELRATVLAAFDDPTIETKALMRWLAERHDIPIGYDSLRRHARGDCGCE